MSIASLFIILVIVSSLGQAATTFSGEILKSISLKNDCALHQNNIVAAVWDKAGADDNPAAIKLRASFDSKEINLLFLNIVLISLIVSHFFSIFLSLDFEINACKLLLFGIGSTLDKSTTMVLSLESFSLSLLLSDLDKSSAMLMSKFFFDSYIWI